MKVLRKIMILSLVLGISMLSSCSDDDNYTAGSKTNTDSLNVYFENISSSTLALTQDSFTVNVIRNRTKGELTVPLTFVSSNGYDEKNNPLFSAPSSVKFMDGKDTATVTIHCTDSVKIFTSYKVTLSVPDSYTIQYSSNPVGQPRMELTVIKEDYKDYAVGVYTSQFFGDGTTDFSQTATLQYSAIKQKYRFTKVIEGQTYTFNVASDNSISYDWSSVDTGSTYPGYGAIYALPSEDKAYKSYFDSQTNKYYFGFSYKVSAGAFSNNYYDVFTVTTKL